MDAERGLGLAFSVVLGLVMGSAVTALVYRVPRGRSWVRGRSACPACGAALAVRDLLPVVSFLLARARCRHCGARISWRYPVTELWCALWAALLYLRVGPAPALPLLAMWGFLLVALFWIDLDVQLLPDVLTLPGALIGVGAALTLPGGARHALLGVIVGSGVLWLLGWAYFRVRKIEGMGFGDVKLGLSLGLALGAGAVTSAFVALLVAMVTGAVAGIVLLMRHRDRRRAFAFGPCLGFGTVVALLLH